MWTHVDVSMTRTWEHNRMTREIERTTGKKTSDWFKRLDRYQARKRGFVPTIAWLTDKQHLPHHLATTLAWNYFNPSTLPSDVAARIGEKYHTRELRLLHGPSIRKARPSPRRREGRPSRAAHAVRRKK